MLNSYSLLQDRYFGHMRAAGFDGFERGERGSTAEHLDVLDYKIRQDEKRLGRLDQQVEKNRAKAEKLGEEITVKSKAKATIAEVDAMGKPTLLGNGFTVTNDEMAKLKSLAKKGVGIDRRAEGYKKKIATLDERISDLNAKLRDAKAEVNHWHGEYTDLWNEVKDLIGAIRKFPARMRDFVTELFRPEREAEQQREQERQTQHQKRKSYEIGGR
jgi:chromosome segregation ATPase